MLQPHYPSLPFFAYPPFYGPAWDEFALAVRSHAAASEPQSLLLQRALPELSSVLKSSRKAVLHNSNRLASGLDRRLEGLQGSLNGLLQGQVPITLTGYFGAPPPGTAPPLAPGSLAAAGGLASTQPPSWTPLPPAAPSVALAPAPSPPVVTALAKAFTVQDVWREWKEGFAGQRAVRELEGQ